MLLIRVKTNKQLALVNAVGSGYRRNGSHPRYTLGRESKESCWPPQLRRVTGWISNMWLGFEAPDEPGCVFGKDPGESGNLAGLTVKAIENTRD